MTKKCGEMQMKYTVITKDMQSLRQIQQILEKREQTPDLFLECDFARAEKKERFRETDLLLIEAGRETEMEIEALKKQSWAGRRPEIILLLTSWNEELFRRIGPLQELFFLNAPFETACAEKIIGEAVEKRKRSLEYERLCRQKKEMERHEQMIRQQFWSRLLEGQIFADPSVFLTEAADYGVEIRLEDSFHAAVFSRKLIQERTIEVERTSRARLVQQGTAWFAACGGSYYFVEQLRPVLIGKNIPAEEFVQQCEAFRKSLSAQTDIPLCIYYETGIYCENLFSSVQKILLAEKEDWAEKPGVYPAVVHHPEKERDTKSMLPEQMETFLENGSYLTAVQVMEDQLIEREEKKQISSEFLRALRWDLTQIMMCTLRKREVPAHQIFDEEELKDLAGNAHVSIESFLLWFRAVLERFPQEEKELSQTEKIQQYVKKHIYETITREDLAGKLYVNADYMSRQYKQNTGETLGQYMTREKMKKAAELLLLTEQPVGEIGAMLGFDNFAHFSKLFKKVIGCTPKEYRKKKKEEKQETKNEKRP